MNCEAIRPLLTQYALGDLDKTAAGEIREHLASCDGCRAALRDVETTLDLLQDALATTKREVPQRLSPAHRVRIMAGMRARMRLMGWVTRGHPRLALAAGVVLAIGFLWLAVASLRHGLRQAHVRTDKDDVIETERIVKLERAERRDKAEALDRPAANEELLPEAVSLPRSARPPMPGDLAVDHERAAERVPPVRLKGLYGGRSAAKSSGAVAGPAPPVKDRAQPAASTLAADELSESVTASRAESAPERRLDFTDSARAVPTGEGGGVDIGQVRRQSEAPSRAEPVPSEEAESPASNAIVFRGGAEDQIDSVRRPHGGEPKGRRLRATGVDAFCATAERPVSSFQMEVDTTAYALTRRYAAQGLLPPCDAVRAEEFVNFFDYNYESPRRAVFRIYAEAAPSKFGPGLLLLKIGVKAGRLERDLRQPSVIGPIARDVKIEVAFNRGRVVRYRQLGCEQGHSRHEALGNDAVKGETVGAGEAVTTLYELQTDGAGEEPIAVVRVHYRRPASDKVEQIERQVVTADVAHSFEAASVRLRLAACAAEFAEILRGSPFAAGSRYEDVASALRPVARELAGDGAVQELLRIVEGADDMGRAAR